MLWRSKLQIYALSCITALNGDLEYAPSSTEADCVLSMREQQMKAFASDALARFEAQLVDHALTFSPRHAASLGRDQLQRCIHAMLSRARSHGFALRGPSQLWVELTFMFGTAFDMDPQLGALADFVRPVPGSNEADELRRAINLREAAVSFANRIAGHAGEREHAAVKRFRGLSLKDGAVESNQEIIELLKYVHPEKVEAVGTVPFQQVVSEARSQAQAYRLNDPAGPTAIALLMFTFGYGCMDDPLFPWIAESLGDVRLDARARLELTRRKALRFVSVESGGE